MFLFKKRFLQKVNDSVAQLVEHYTFNVGVLGSNPSGITVRLIKVTQNRSSFNTRAVFLFQRILNKIKTTQTFCEIFLSSVNIIVSRKNQLIERMKKIKKETIKKRKQYVINPK
jgi:hypothetical protein